MFRYTCHVTRESNLSAKVRVGISNLDGKHFIPCLRKLACPAVSIHSVTLDSAITGEFSLCKKIDKRHCFPSEGSPSSRRGPFKGAQIPTFNVQGQLWR